MLRLTKMQAVLAERVCEHCNEGLLKYKGQYDEDIKNRLFRKPKHYYEYECENCNKITKSDKILKLQYIMYVDPETKRQYRES